MPSDAHSLAGPAAGLSAEDKTAEIDAHLQLGAMWTARDGAFPRARIRIAVHDPALNPFHAVLLAE